MASPFPGMNPYLEHPERWSSVHNRLIVALAQAGRRAAEKYEQKRQQVLNSSTHLVEIDLLREGEPLAIAGSPVTSSYSKAC